MAGPNRFLGSDSPEKKGLEVLLGYLRSSIEKGTEVDLACVKTRIDESKFSPEELETIRAEALRGARKYGEEACKSPSDKPKQTLAGALAAIATYAAKKSGYRHEPSEPGLEYGD